MDLKMVIATGSNVASIVSAIIALVIALRAYRRTERQEKWALRDSYDAMISERSVFWDGLREAYDLFREERVREEEARALPENLIAFLDSCGMPPGLFELDNIRLYELKNGTRNQRILYEFTSAIYPLGTRTREGLVTASIIRNEIANDFFDSRSKVSGFWDRWAGRIATTDLASDYAKERSALIMLTWLDIAHRKWTGEDDAGKTDMYGFAAELLKRHRKNSP